MFRTALLGILAGMLPLAAAAQNTGGVFGPVVNKGHRYAEYRITVSPSDADGLDTVWAQRFHVEDTPTDRIMWRVFAQVRRDPFGETEFDSAQAEIFTELRGPEHRWRTGFRFDGRVRGDGPGQMSVNWTNEFALSEKLITRAVLLTTKQFGDRASDGVLLETRLNLQYRFENRVQAGVELYNGHGSTADFQTVSDRLQVGPYAFIPIGEHWRGFVGVLATTGNGAYPADTRFWLGRSF
ncbi:hypothetical protein [Parvularcula maris]|uniref:Copper resistance protein B n=1 Tax=Parvularcula maris TaxID=2965077 RepID=A0A9X2L9F8_9PROT|nr:hypothetical protein [Parvularcula maris]MCQ8185487.1 hypothetical protein [Parvularcula maris]